MATDWDELSNQYGQAVFASAGIYGVKIEDIEVKEVGTKGSIAVNFIFEETDGLRFPKVTHWLSFKNNGWRKWHHKCILQMLLGDEEKAKQSIDVCEGKSGKDAIVKAYEQAYKKIAAKHPKVTIEVWQGEKYSEADFNDNTVRMNRPEKKEEGSAVDDILDANEETTEDLSVEDLPF